jgi:hypothetical protein
MDLCYGWSIVLLPAQNAKPVLSLAVCSLKSLSPASGGVIASLPRFQLRRDCSSARLPFNGLSILNRLRIKEEWANDQSKRLDKQQSDS